FIISRDALSVLVEWCTLVTMGKSFPDSSGVAESAQISQAWDNHSVLTKQQAAAYIQCCPRYIERMVRNGRLRALKPTGKLIRFRRRDLDAFLQSGATIGGVR